MRLPWPTKWCGRVGYVLRLFSSELVPAVENLFANTSSAAVRRADFQVCLADRVTGDDRAAMTSPQ